jgi:hypothetical protein
LHHFHEILHDIHDLRHLEEDEDLRMDFVNNDTGEGRTLHTLWPVAKNLGKILASNSSLPDDRTILSSIRPAGFILSSTLSNKNGCWQIFRNCMSSLLKPFTPPDFLTSNVHEHEHHHSRNKKLTPCRPSHLQSSYASSSACTADSAVRSS